ncbi:MAG: RecQ family ATP-dependent DNA helicase [Clostridia bacterium]|nr:RecQ family ATP-dependent DNA helicase [Clostridia bacterium]
MDKTLIFLKQYFGYTSFRKGQSEIICNLLNKQDCLAILPTGAGKSICYQIPALIFNNLTIVISPLISLMKDQVDKLNKKNIPAIYINSTMHNSAYKQVLRNIQLNKYKIIYIAPERLHNKNFLEIIKKTSISLIAIDEAHCVSEWGHDFRKSYLDICNFVSSLSNRPVIAAFTATATNLVQKDIINILALKNPFILKTTFNRENLSFFIESPISKTEFILNFLEKNHFNSGIIYCNSRKNVDFLYDYLSLKGYFCSKYHAGLTSFERASYQNLFLYNKCKIMIATNAFGMGIDKQAIRYVIHYNMPKNIESYYQEAGRAGRDQNPAKCILLFSNNDIFTNKFLIERGSKNKSYKLDYQRLDSMINYCTTKKCLRSYLLEYFGEKPKNSNCGNCGNCIKKVDHFL